MKDAVECSFLLILLLLFLLLLLLFLFLLLFVFLLPEMGSHVGSMVSLNRAV